MTGLWRRKRRKMIDDPASDVARDYLRSVERPYDTLLNPARHRPTKTKGRTLEEEADADRGRALFSAPFRRLQNKAQVFSLETNAAVRSRLTHSLEVSSIGRFVAQQAIKAFEVRELEELGIAGKERPFITFVEAAGLLHDLGNPPFGHFGEIAISDWFHLNAEELRPEGIGGSTIQLWDEYYTDFRHFDGNPQGFRIVTRLQAAETGDLDGLNLTATTLAATLKYPWPSTQLSAQQSAAENAPKKAGYFRTEDDVVLWLRDTLGLNAGARHPLVYLMEAADDIAYCVSDIEDGIEKGAIAAPQFAEYMSGKLESSQLLGPTLDLGDKDVQDILQALSRLRNPRFRRAEDDREVERLIPFEDFRSGVIRFLARQAGLLFRQRQEKILNGDAAPILRDAPLLKALRDFVEASLYSSWIVRQREITAHAVLCGLLGAYLPLMSCDRDRFVKSLAGERRDDRGRPIGRESSLVSHIAKKYLAVYRETVQRSEQELGNSGEFTVKERIHRMRLVVDHISGMTDEFALQSFQLITGSHINPHRS